MLKILLLLIHKKEIYLELTIHTFWIVIKRYFDSVFMRGYDKNTNIMNDAFILVSLVDLNNDYTYFAEILLVEENDDL